MAPSGDSRQSETLSDSSGPKRAHSLPSWDQHRVLPHLRGLLLWLRARGGRCDDTWELCSRAQLPATTPKSCRGALHLHQRLEGAPSHLAEGERDDTGAEGGQEEEAAGVVFQLSSADEGKVHRGHRRDLLQKRLTVVLLNINGVVKTDFIYFMVCGEM